MVADLWGAASLDQLCVSQVERARVLSPCASSQVCSEALGEMRGLSRPRAW